MTTLSLKLPPEVAKIMPWIVAAKATGNPKQIAWAKHEYKIASEQAAQRERWEREIEAIRREDERREQAEEECWERYFEEEQKKRERWAILGIHFAEEDGSELIQPRHSSTKGRRRLHSQLRAEGAVSFKCTHGLAYARHDWGRKDFGGTSRYRIRHRPRHKNGLLKDGRKPRTFRDYR